MTANSRDWQARGDAAMEAQDLQQAMDAYCAALELDPGNVQVCRCLADLYVGVGLIEEAFTISLQLLDLLEAQDDLNGALEAARRLQILDPSGDRGWCRSILIHMKAGNVAEVVRESRVLAQRYADGGHWERAAALLTRAREADPGDPDIVFELAEMVVGGGDVQAGARLFRQVAHEYLERNDPDKAIAAFTRWDFIKRCSGGES